MALPGGVAVGRRGVKPDGGEPRKVQRSSQPTPATRISIRPA
jgi:hypothetical protein